MVTITKKDKEQYPLLSGLRKKGLVIWDGTCYTMQSSGNILAENKKEAEEKLRENQPPNEGKQVNGPDTGNQETAPSLEDATAHETGTLSDELEQVIPDNEDYGDILGQLGDVKSGSTATFDVLYKGIDLRMTDHPVIKAFPFKIHWPRRCTDENPSINGFITGDVNGPKCEDWPVFSKKRHAKIYKHLTIGRDDTPDHDFVTCDVHVLCIGKREQIEALRNGKTIKVMKEAKQQTESYKKIGQDFAKHKDIDKARDSLKSLPGGGDFQEQLAELDPNNYDRI